MHPSRIDPRPHGNTLKSWPPKHFKSLLIMIKKSLTLSCLAWNCLRNSKFNIHFFFQNLFKCYKWKDDFKAYSIIYSKIIIIIYKN